MSNGTHDPLGSLNLHFAESFTEHDKTKIDELYAYYIRDFFDRPFQCTGNDVKVKDELYTKHPADGLPDYFGRYQEKFVHLITREVPGRTVVQSKRRIFKENRANRIHWIKPILEYSEDPRIIYFRFLEADGNIREYFWYKAMDYIIILEKILPDYYLVTAFCVDYSNRPYYERKFAGKCGP